ncbi:MAG: hypothetical protein ACOX3Q_02140 [Clostridia bacterium]|jgi:nicotinamidase-related amidase|nr:hypothetical protein [Clostridiaceae bacterium]
MSIVTVPAWYYRQFDADYSRDIPGEGYGGWMKADLKLNTDKTAFVVMHAWDCGTYEEHPGWYRAVEYIPRANKIAREIFPGLLSAIRNAGMKLYHVAGSESHCKGFPGFEYAKQCLKEYTQGKESFKMPYAERDAVSDELRKFRFENVFVGLHNKADIERGQAKATFMKEAMPADNEPIALDGDQLQAVCLKDGINHLIYMGFAINWCLQYSPASMNDMANRGFLCSAIREAVTAVENKESARTERHKEYGLWVTALKNGFVYDLKDIQNMLSTAVR